MKKVLITGIAGFVGSYLAKHFLKNNYKVIGIDNICNSYDIKLKLDRLEDLGFSTKEIIDEKEIFSKKIENLSYIKSDLTNKLTLSKIFEKDFEYVVHLAAYTGVRDSIDHPELYIQSNIVGFSNIIEEAARKKIKHFIYASSSSVYGSKNEEVYTEDLSCEYPLVLYGATKKSNELIAHSYSNIYKLPTTGLRFFNVYGKFGRPDMAPFIFTDSIYTGKEFTLNNKGNMYRDLVHVNDIASSIVSLTENPSKTKEDNTLGSSPFAPYRVVNIGNSENIKIIDFVKLIEKILNKKAKYKKGPMHAAEALKTLASTEKLEKITKFKPYTNLEEGMRDYIKWHLEYYKGV
jgi:UDP-glucuronate 4-epimerase